MFFGISLFVMTGLDPVIHVFAGSKERVDGRVKHGRDGRRWVENAGSRPRIAQPDSRGLEPAILVASPARRDGRSARLHHFERESR
jgi:hypothetical protein